MPEGRTIDLGGTNCYLIEGGEGFALIDTGFPHSRARLLDELREAGCRRDDLSLIVLTHGDIDHSGNAAHLREHFGAPIAMHPGDAAMCLSDGETRERDTRPPDDFPTVLYFWLAASVSRYLVRKMLRRDTFDAFSPDILLADGQDLRPLGLDAVVYHTPGHSKGSIALLTPEGDLYCGDQFGQVWGHVIAARDDPDYPPTSDKLRSLRVRMIYPGHGEAFAPDRTGLRRPSARFADTGARPTSASSRRTDRVRGMRDNERGAQLTRQIARPIDGGPWRASRTSLLVCSPSASN